METYFQQRKGLRRVVQLVDIRHKPTAQDVQMYEYLQYYGLSGLVVATKSDKVSRSEMQKNIAVIKKALSLTAEDKVIAVSSLKKTGWEQLLLELDRILEE